MRGRAEKKKHPLGGAENGLRKCGKTEKSTPEIGCANIPYKGCAYAQTPKAVQETSDENKLLIIAIFALMYLFVMLSASFRFIFVFVCRYNNADIITQKFSVVNSFFEIS